MEKLFWKLRRFCSSACQLAVLDMAAGKRWIVDSTSRNIPYLKAENVRDRHILIQPVEQDTYLMADDITPELLLRHHKLSNGTWKPGRMVVETSPDNFQVWIHAHRPLPLEEKRYWLKIMKSDPGADPCNRWGRCPGFRNRKEKYRDTSGHYPLAKLVWVDWRQTAHIPPPILAPAQHKTLPLSHLPLEGGECVVLKIFPAVLIIVMMNLPLTLLMPWPCFEGGCMKMTSDVCFWNTEMIGQTIQGQDKRRHI